MKVLNVNIPGKEYEICINKGLFESFGKEIRKVYKNNKIAVITDANLHVLYGERLHKVLSNEGFQVDFFVVQPGESSKSLETLENVYSSLASFNITRSDLIIAFGGGVVGDLAGFAASTFLRGINYIQIPTSLLAQIDSSIGGKVAINLREGKNLAGSFYHPIKVLIDPDLLISLPERYIRDGLGEVVKYACIKDEALFDYLCNINIENELFANMEQIIYTCLYIKKELVEADEKDLNMRLLLNFGHTIGHAIEKHTNYEVSHGEAVSAGMLRITKSSEVLGFTETGTYEKIKRILEHFNMECDYQELSNKELIKYISLDKKNISGNLNIVLLKKIGDAFVHKIPQSEIENFFTHLEHV
jgi:3-dehydroquinate synthase